MAESAEYIIYDKSKAAKAASTNEKRPRSAFVSEFLKRSDRDRMDRLNKSALQNTFGKLEFIEDFQM